MVDYDRTIPNLFTLQKLETNFQFICNWYSRKRLFKNQCEIFYCGQRFKTAIGKKGENYANRLENIVFIELLRRGYTVDVGKLDSKEIDFIARKADGILYVQVAFEIPENTHETDNLLHIKDNYKKILITGKYYEQTEIDGIEVIYVVDWLLQ